MSAPLSPSAATSEPVMTTEQARVADTVGPPAGAAPAQFTPEQEADIKHLNKIIKETRTCMLTTAGAHGIHSRPMATAGIDFDTHSGEFIYFVTEKGTTKVEEISSNSSVALIFSNDSKNEWASITATARVVDDREKTKQLWSPIYNAYFPGGPEDPKLILIEATPISAQYWDANYATRLHIMFAALRAKFTGKPIDQGLSQDSKTVTF